MIKEVKQFIHGASTCNAKDLAVLINHKIEAGSTSRGTNVLIDIVVRGSLFDKIVASICI